MDNQRLILFLIFSFSLVMLWDAWHKQGTPGQVANPPAAATVAAPAVGGAAAPVPVPTAETIPATTVAAQVDTAAKVAVTTDLFVAEVSAQGGDLTRLELRAHKATGDKDSNFVLFEAKHSYSAQGGLIGPGLPTHKTVWQLPASGVEMKDGEQELRVRLMAPAVDGVQVAKTYVFKRGSYLIDVEYEIANGSGAAIAPHAYFQLTRDGKAPEGANSMMSTFTGPAFYTAADKFQKSSFEDITKKKAKVPGKTDNGWVAMVQHYFVAAWLPGQGEREFYLREIGKDLFAAGVIVPVAQIAPGAAGKVAVPLYAGPQEQENLAAVAPGSIWWLTMVG
jgi:YidC/Oxa1 family membrane protein insertase